MGINGGPGQSEGTVPGRARKPSEKDTAAGILRRLTNSTANVSTGNNKSMSQSWIWQISVPCSCALHISWHPLVIIKNSEECARKNTKTKGRTACCMLTFKLCYPNFHNTPLRKNEVQEMEKDWETQSCSALWDKSEAWVQKETLR